LLIAFIVDSTFVSPARKTQQSHDGFVRMRQRYFLATAGVA
jgi:hypothetical protein